MSLFQLPWFPLLAIEIPWSPNILTLGGFMLTWHGLFTAIGILAGVQLSLRMGRAVRYDPDEAYTLALVGVPSGIVGARTLFVAEHWDYYRQAPLEILALNEGGISVWGAVIGGLLAATFVTLTILPSIYAIVQRTASLTSPSLNPMEPSSRYYDAQ